jgi:hypothetical protein
VAIMTREQFAEFVSPSQLKLLHDGIRLGLADYADPENYSSFARLSHTTSIRAQIRNGHMVYRVERMARERPELGITPKMINRRRLFYINQRARVSLKMLNQDHRHSNYPTSQAVAFDAQLWLGDVLDALDEIPAVRQVALWPEDAAAMVPITNVIAGYVLEDDSETTFQILIICPDGAGNAWEWALTSVDIEELVVASKPAETVAATKIRRRRLPIRIRDGVAKKDGTSDANGQA